MNEIFDKPAEVFLRAIDQMAESFEGEPPPSLYCVALDKDEQQMPKLVPDLMVLFISLIIETNRTVYEALEWMVAHRSELVLPPPSIRFGWCLQHTTAVLPSSAGDPVNLAALIDDADLHETMRNLPRLRMIMLASPSLSETSIRILTREGTTIRMAHIAEGHAVNLLLQLCQP